MHDSGEMSVYPKAGMFRNGRRLYSIIGPSISCWHDFWELGPNVAYSHVGSPAMQVWRIKRAMRSYLQRRLEQRNLAIAMSMHARLGCEAGLGALGEDILLVLILATRTTTGL